jgi:hypothetical protein
MTMADRVRIPVGGRGLDSERVGEVLASAGDTVRVESDAAARRSVDMDPATVSMVVDVALAVPALLTAVAGAWSRFKKRSSPAPATVVVETAGDEVTVRIAAGGGLTTEDGEPVDAAALPSSADQIVRIHLR